MELEKGRRYIPGGGRAHDTRTGSIHLSVRSGSRSRGASASAAFAYVTRTRLKPRAHPWRNVFGAESA